MPSCEEDGGFGTEGGLESRGDEEEGRETLKFHRGVSPPQRLCLSEENSGVSERYPLTAFDYGIQHHQWIIN